MFLVYRALLGAPYVGPVTSNVGLKTVLQFDKNDRLLWANDRIASSMHSWRVTVLIIAAICSDMGNLAIL